MNKISRSLEQGNLDSAKFIAMEASIYYEHLLQPHLVNAEVNFFILEKTMEKMANDESFEPALSEEWSWGMDAIYKALNIEFNNSFARYYRAYAYLLANNTDSAKADIEMALKAEPANSLMLQLKQMIAEAPGKIKQKYKTPEAKSRLCVSLGMTYRYHNEWIAYNYFEEALRHNPKNITAIYFQGFTLRVNQIYKLALEKLNTGLKIDSNNRYIKNEFYQLRFSYDPSRTDMKELMSKSRDEEFNKYKNDLNNECGKWLDYFSKKQWDSAAPIIGDCMVCPGISISASFNNRGIAFYNLKKYEAAISDLKNAILLGGVYHNGHPDYLLARIYYEQGKKAMAEEILKEALPLYPENKRLAELQKEFGSTSPVQQPPSANNKPPVQKQPVTASDFYREALIAKNNRDYNKALIYFKNSLELNPGNDSCLFDRGLMYYEMKAYSVAIKDFTDAAILNFTDVKYYLYIAAAQYEQGNYEAAIARLNSVIAMDASNGNAYKIRSMAYCKKGNTAKADEDAKKAASLNQGTDMSCAQLLSTANQQMAESKKESANGIALFTSKKDEEAAIALRSAVEKWSGNQDAYYYLANVYYRQQMGHVADAYMKQLEYLNPNYPGAQKLAISIATLKGLQ
jgi:tetratricopeptide (TPR) repeat protein